MEAEMNAYGDLNPAKFDELKRAAFLAKEAAYRWTGIHTLKRFFLQPQRKYIV